MVHFDAIICLVLFCISITRKGNQTHTFQTSSQVTVGLFINIRTLSEGSVVVKYAALCAYNAERYVARTPALIGLSAFIGLSA